jgi:DNA-binding PadR family transcriptional regulator
MPVSNLEIVKIIVESKFMNYFYLQQLLNELCNDALITSKLQESNTFYSITPNGKRTLDFFPGLIPGGIKSMIDNRIPVIRNNIRNQTLVTADFEPGSEDEFIVTCKVNEDNFSLIELKITVGTKSDARKICDNWEKHSQKIYAEVIESLTKNRE